MAREPNIPITSEDRQAAARTARHSVEAMHQKIGQELLRLSGQFEDRVNGDIHPYEMRLKPARDGAGWLVIVKATWEDRKIVGFSGGSTVTDALYNTSVRMRQQAIKWREDEFARAQEEENVLGEEPA